MTSLIPRLQSRQRNARNSSKPNPYAGRGLDKLALVTAELSAKREKLAAQLGEGPVSVVRFTAGPQSNWIPIFIHETHRSPPHGTDGVPHQISDTFHPDVAVSHSPLPIHPISLKSDINSRATLYKFWTLTDYLWPQLIKTAILVLAMLGTFWAGKIAVAGFTVTVALAHGTLFLKKHSQDFSARDDALNSVTEIQGRSSSPDFTDYAGQELPTESATVGRSNQSQMDISSRPPALRRLDADSAVLTRTTNNAASTGSCSKQHNRFKSKFVHTHLYKKKPITAPSSPLASTKHNFSSSIPTSPSLKGRYGSAGDIFTAEVNRSHKFAGKLLEEEKIVSHGQYNEKLQEKIIRKPVSSLTAIWLVVAMAGLLAGYTFSILGVLCWWYVLPKLRGFGTKPLFRVHADVGKIDQKVDNKNTVSNGHGKSDLQSSEYSRKEIMDQ